jgi:hypothetical protein
MFFGLCFEEAGDVWNAAMRLKRFGGSGEAERLAQLGDALLYSVTTSILQEDVTRSPRDVHDSRQRYIMNRRLSRLDGPFHFSHFLKWRYPHLKIVLNDHDIGTLIEALVGAASKFHKEPVLREVVRCLMRMMDPCDAVRLPSRVPVPLCGSRIVLTCGPPPTAEEAEIVSGLVDCCSPDGFQLLPFDWAQQLENAIRSSKGTSSASRPTKSLEPAVKRRRPRGRKVAQQ